MATLALVGGWGEGRGWPVSITQWQSLKIGIPARHQLHHLHQLSSISRNLPIRWRSSPGASRDVTSDNRLHVLHWSYHPGPHCSGRDRSHVNVSNVALKLGFIDVAKCWYRAAGPDTPRIVRIQGNYSRGRKRPVSVAAWWQPACSLLLSLNVWCPLPWWIIAVPLCPGALPRLVSDVRNGQWRQQRYREQYFYTFKKTDGSLKQLWTNIPDTTCSDVQKQQYLLRPSSCMYCTPHSEHCQTLLTCLPLPRCVPGDCHTRTRIKPSKLPGLLSAAGAAVTHGLQPVIWGHSCSSSG